MSSSHLQEVRKDHLGRVRPARRPGPRPRAPSRALRRAPVRGTRPRAPAPARPQEDLRVAGVGQWRRGPGDLGGGAADAPLGGERATSVIREVRSRHVRSELQVPRGDHGEQPVVGDRDGPAVDVDRRDPGAHVEQVDRPALLEHPAGHRPVGPLARTSAASPRRPPTRDAHGSSACSPATSRSSGNSSSSRCRPRAPTSSAGSSFPCASTCGRRRRARRRDAGARASAEG